MYERGIFSSRWRQASFFFPPRGRNNNMFNKYLWLLTILAVKNIGHYTSGTVICFLGAYRYIKQGVFLQTNNTTYCRQYAMLFGSITFYVMWHDFIWINGMSVLHNNISAVLRRGKMCSIRVSAILVIGTMIYINHCRMVDPDTLRPGQRGIEMEKTFREASHRKP